MSKQLQVTRTKEEIDELEFPGHVVIDRMDGSFSTMWLDCELGHVGIVTTILLKMNLSAVENLRDVLTRYIEWRATQPDQEEKT